MKNNIPRIFLLSHMRANTSLMGHIIGSHPNVSGYYEMHINYSSINNLQQQEFAYSQTDCIKVNTLYLFDKLLHNKYSLNLANLNNTQIELLVAIRPAEQSIKSIINLFNNKNNNHPYAKLDNAIEYYTNRIDYLANFCIDNSKKYYYYDADLIRINPHNLLLKLQHWIGLDVPFSKNYLSFSQTGKSRAGDSSIHIHSGDIITQQTNYDKIIIAADVLENVINHCNKQRHLIIENAIDSITS